MLVPLGHASNGLSFVSPRKSRTVYCDDSINRFRRSQRSDFRGIPSNRFIVLQTNNKTSYVKKTFKKAQRKIKKRTSGVLVQRRQWTEPHSSKRETWLTRPIGTLFN